MNYANASNALGVTMRRFSLVSNYANLWGLLLLADDRVWNWTTGAAEAVPADDFTPGREHLAPLRPFREKGPLKDLRRLPVPLDPSILDGAELVVFVGDGNGGSLQAFDSWPAFYFMPFVFGRGGWSRAPV